MNVEKIAEAGTRLIAIEIEIDDTERRLEALKAERRQLSEQILPDMLDQAGVDRMGLPQTGADIVLKPFYHATLPKDPEERSRAIDWLISAGHGDLLKTEMSVEFGRQEHNIALDCAGRVRETLAAIGMDNTVHVESGVHHMTLTKFVKEQTEAEVTLPLDLLGATCGRVAIIRWRKR